MERWEVVFRRGKRLFYVVENHLSREGGSGVGVGNWFDDNIRRVVGNGRNTFFWTDNWLDGAPLKLQFSRLYELSVHKKCLVEDMARLG